MADPTLDKQKRAIARNLIETRGLHQAFHAATQFGWHDIADRIRDEIEQSRNTLRSEISH